MAKKAKCRHCSGKGSWIVWKLLFCSLLYFHIRGNGLRTFLTVEAVYQMTGTSSVACTCNSLAQRGFSEAFVDVLFLEHKTSIFLNTSDSLASRYNALWSTAISSSWVLIPIRLLARIVFTPIESLSPQKASWRIDAILSSENSPKLFRHKHMKDFPTIAPSRTGWIDMLQHLKSFPWTGSTVVHEYT